MQHEITPLTSEAKKIVSDITDFLNTYNRDRNKEFCNAMSTEHRTLQQDFTRLCFNWIEFVASDNYRTDDRNIDSKEICQILLKRFKEHQSIVYTGETLELMSKPSLLLRNI